MAKYKELRVGHGPVDPDITLTAAEKDFLRAWNRQGEIDGEPNSPDINPLDPNGVADAAADAAAGQYDGLSIDDLKEALRNRELPVSGNKAALIERLNDDDDDVDVDNVDDDNDDDEE